MSIVQKLKQRNHLEKTDLDYITSSHIYHSLKPIKKLFDMNNVPFSLMYVLFSVVFSYSKFECANYRQK